MKVIVLALLVAASVVRATNFIVSVVNDSYHPNSIAAETGDTIEFQIGGVAHTLSRLIQALS
jgi:hypothetical protein